jgi:hypothetical protein
MSKLSAIKALFAAMAMAVLMGLPIAGSAWASEPLGIETFTNPIVKGLGAEAATQAGSHPYSMTTTIAFDHHETEFGPAPNGGEPKDIEVTLPPGLIANPTATPTRCTEAQLEKSLGTGGEECPNSADIGVSVDEVAFEGAATNLVSPVYNMVPPPGVPAEFGINVEGLSAVIHIVGKLRGDDEYRLAAEVEDITQKLPVVGAKLTLWGNPSDPSHNAERGICVTRGPAEQATERAKFEQEVEEGKHPEESAYRFNCPVERSTTPLLTMPTSCTGAPLVTNMSADTWQEPGNFVEASTESPAVTGCEGLSFAPSLSVQPVEPAASTTESPTGLEVNLNVPQEESLDGLAESDLKEATVTLPAGLTVSPSAANGLGACSEAQIELNGPNTPSCPDSSKLGSVEVVTPLLEAPLKGAVYLAQQGNLVGAGSNPFKSLFALYLVAEGSGALVKLPGEVRLDPVTGQVSAKFGEDPTTGFYLPQLPFSELKMRFFGGPRAPLMTGASCGTFTMSSVLTPWDGNVAAERGSSFTVGSGCGAQGFSPGFTAGTANNQAAGNSSFGVTISRNDGEQDLGGVSVTTPPGLLGTLKNVVQCPEPQASRGECSQASEIGETTAAVGPGVDPYWVHGGHVYLTGPYNGGPFGLSIVVPTVAGPFTLTGNGGPGREVVRASIRVNPVTSQITVVSDPLPTMLEGVPLDIRTVNVNINRPDFMFNPTSCAPLSVTGTLASTQGASATVSSPFEAANCAALPFKPTFSASTQARASKADGTSLRVIVTSGAGQANIGKVDLQLPVQLPSRLTTLQKACTEAQFDANPAGCPEASFIGTAVAHTPVLNAPLVGPAILVSHGGAAFPDVEFLLQGEGVEILLDGKTQIKSGITYSHFDTVPDAPISSFETVLPAGPYSILGANVPASAKYSLCGQSLIMPTTITGQNGAVITQETKVAITGTCPKVVKAKPKTLTRAKKLVRALKACRAKDKHSKAMRQKCERQARRKYGANRRKGKK